MFFVIALGALLWAVLLSSQGDMLWVSLILVIVVLGVTFFKIFNQISANASKKKAQKELTDDLRVHRYFLEML
jgi:Na+/H+ antiporter NhaB